MVTLQISDLNIPLLMITFRYIPIFDLFLHFIPIKLYDCCFFFCSVQELVQKYIRLMQVMLTMAEMLNLLTLSV